MITDVHSLPQEVERIFPSMRNKAGKLRVVKHQELFTNNEKLVKEDCELEKRVVFEDLEMAAIIMSRTFYMALCMHKEAPSLIMVTNLLAFITSLASVLIFSMIIALGVTKDTLRKLPMRCGLMSIELTLALLTFAVSVKVVPELKGHWMT